MRNGIEIQREANEVDQQIAQVLVDLNKWKTRKAELELEIAQLRSASFEQQVAQQQAAQKATEQPTPAEGEKAEEKK